MVDISNKIKCPHCNKDFHLEDVFKEHLEELNNQKKINEKNTEKLQEYEELNLLKLKELEEANTKNSILKSKLDNFENEKENAVKEAIILKEEELKNTLKKDLEKENSETIAKLLEVEKKSLDDSYRIKYSKEIQLAQDSVPPDFEKRLILAERKNSQFEEYIKQLKRKSEQGAVEAQGEAQEILIENFLTSLFPNDTIVPVKKGARGADSKQIINDKQYKNIGSIIYESKDTQNFSESWVEKLYKDMTNEGIGFGVIVTEAMPKEYDGGLLYRYDGRIVICPMNKNYLKILAQSLRENIIRTIKIQKINHSTDHTKEDLWKIITSDSFSMKLRRYVNFYIKEQEQIDKDNRAAILSNKNRKKILEDKKQTFFSIISDIASIEGTLPENILEHEDQMLLED